MITRTFKLCLNAGTGSAPYINVSQYDEGETWLFELYSETGERYIPSTGAIVGVKSDGHGIINTGTVDSEGRVVITETQQMTAAAGRAIFELSIDGLTHGTANFIVAVERKPTDEAVMSDSDLSLIQQAVDSAETIEELIEGHDPDEVIADAVDTWLDAHPEATTTVLDGAITAPKINNSLWDKILVNEEASGAVASFDDGADDVPVSSLKVALEPIQTGTGDPSPSNIRPISGHSSVTVERTGKNLLNYNDLTQSAIGAGIAVNADGTIYDSSPTADSRSWNYASCNWQMTLPAGTYTFTIECTTPNPESVAQCRGFKSDGTSLFTNIGSDIFKTGGIATRTFTFTDITTFGIIVKQYSVVYRVQIETGETSTDFEPYIRTSYPYTLGQSVYGGTVDLATGVLTVDTVSKTISSVSGWANRISNQNRVYATAVGVFGSTDVPYTYTSEAEMIADGMNLCDKMLVKNTSNSATTPTFTVGLSTYIYLNGVTHIDGVTDMESLETWINDNPLQITYRLATPQTINLTPTEVKTLLGYNNISSSGTVEVIYHADTKLYVDKMTAVDNNIIAPTEEGFTATRNYTVNDLVIVNDTLYKVTANIATGSAITPNSNVTQTTLSALIKALS